MQNNRSNGFKRIQLEEAFLEKGHMVNKGVLIRIIESAKQRESAGGIIITSPDDARQEETHMGEVIKIDATCEIDLQVGDIVTISRYGGNDIVFGMDTNEYRTCLITEIKMVLRLPEEGEEEAENKTKEYPTQDE